MSALDLKDRFILSALLGAIAFFMLTDLVADLATGSPWSHASLELVIVGLIFGCLAWLWVKKSGELAIFHRVASERQAALEAETAMLVLKGLSNKEIATVRDCSDLTVKQQTHAIFRKSGLTSRAQLIAFFLEDLF